MVMRDGVEMDLQSAELEKFRIRNAIAQRKRREAGANKKAREYKQKERAFCGQEMPAANSGMRDVEE